jgi:hypothetical protein
MAADTAPSKEIFVCKAVKTHSCAILAVMHGVAVVTVAAHHGLKRGRKEQDKDNKKAYKY